VIRPERRQPDWKFDSGNAGALESGFTVDAWPTISSALESEKSSILSRMNQPQRHGFVIAANPERNLVCFHQIC
jgi:hypothetical protein